MIIFKNQHCAFKSLPATVYLCGTLPDSFSLVSHESLQFLETPELFGFSLNDGPETCLKPRAKGSVGR